MQEGNSKVIIIGNDHINTLGVIRTFGENGIKPYLMVISDTKRVAVTKSKYVEKYWLCNDSVNIIELLKKEFKGEKNKPVIIPTTDYVAALLDIYYDELKGIFILPNINKKKGEINYYMDKYNQYLLFKKYNIDCAESIKIELNGNKLDDEIENKIIFPCIVKPLISAFGSKSDIEICDDIDSLNKVLLMLYNKEYKDVLIQELLDYDYECDIAGFVYDNKVSIPGIIKKIRIWPAKKGSTTYGEVMPVKEASLDISNIERMLSEIEYNGVFDIEILVKGNKVYMNEINFRNSAISYSVRDAAVCYYYYLSCIKEEFNESPKITEKYKILDDHADLHNIIDKIISASEYINCKKDSKIKLVYNKEDNRPNRYMLLNKLMNKINLAIILKKSVLKVIHKDRRAYLLKLNKGKAKSSVINLDYDIVKINKENYDIMANGNIRDEKAYKRIFSKEQANGIILKNGEQIIGRGIIKKKGCYDYFVNICRENSYIVSLLHINKPFRGKNYQCDLVSELIKNNIDTIDETNIYAVVYVNNYASLRNMQKLGFEIVKEIQILRAFRKSINKERI